jgi:hypothetical protein
MKTVRWLAWSVGVLFLIGTALQLVDMQNLFATPPAVADSLNMVERRLAIQDYRVAIWPIFALGNLSFGVAFVALAGLGVALSAWLAHGTPRRIAITTAFVVGGVLGAAAQFITVGAAQATIDIAYCDCGFKETEIVSQIWAQMIVEGASNWLLNAAGVLAALGILAVDSSFRRRMPGAWSIVSWLTALGLIATVLVPLFQLGPEELGQYLLLLVSGVLVPIWTIWLGASLTAEPEVPAGADPDTGPA